jgi:hypothetical protein
MDVAREIRLIEYVKANRGRPFAWGQCDCNVFALEAMDAVHDTDLAALMRGRYSSLLGAYLFRRRRLGSLINILKAAGFVEGQKGFEQTGDLLIVSDPKWEMVHICLGSQAVAAFPEHGVMTFPMRELRHRQYSVWRPPSCRL